MTVTFFTDSFKSKIAGHYKGHFANELYPSCSARPGEGEYQRHVFDGINCRNYSSEQCHCRDKLAGREEAEVTPVTPGQLDLPPRALASPLSRRGQCRVGRARLAGLGAGRGCSRTALCITSPSAFCSVVITPLSRAQWGGKAHVSSRQGLGGTDWLRYRHGLPAETAGEAQVKVNFVCEVPVRSIKPTEPRKSLKAGSSGWLTESF